ncbi:mechanosensitive ion channel domain-containing protein [Pseudohongiella sp.]|uniref:BON domain-containing protein n=1 Tax=marine sediment metagenome TaxID=412755 RepID=A0A0F9W904_9ZZZZ|nr:mechanosensitive ion channel domain-containing protein [Pseudohongiella sp.]
MTKFPPILAWLLLVLLASINQPAALAQPGQGENPVASAQSLNPEDMALQERLASIFAVLEPLRRVEVQVTGGVALLSGAAPNEAQAERALTLASQIPGVVAVGDSIERRLDVQGNVSPMMDAMRTNVRQWLRASPLVALAAFIFILIVYLGYALARWSSLWQRLTTNPFLVELIGQGVRITAVVAALVVTLNLLGATALMATILGGAGVLGLAIGFAVRDTMENYICSILMSIRQPFRPNDHVVINTHEGKVVRLTSRATVLMTLQGNQLRIPNATVFKAVILNYTRNPQRRFEFELGVDAADNPVAAMKAGVDAMKALPFMLSDPAPGGTIKTIGDSNIILFFTGWIDQRETDFLRARSLAIRAVTTVLDAEGFSMPEPIYRLRFDAGQNTGALPEQLPVSAARPAQTKQDSDAIDNSAGPRRDPGPDADELLDTRPDTIIEDMVNEERASQDESDLLDTNRPVE